MTRLRWYSLLVSVISLLGGEFALFFMLPKVEAIFREVGGREVFLRFVVYEWVYRASTWHALFWIPILLTAILFLLPLLPALSEVARKRIGIFFTAWSLVCLAMAFWIMGLASVGLMQATIAQGSRIAVYERVLEEFALLESARGRHEAVNARIAAMIGTKPTEIRSADELSPSDRRKRVGTLLILLGGEKSPELRKRLLATALMFRAEVKPGSSEEGKLLEAANELTGQAFASSSDFFKWLEPQVGKDGWDPVGMYKVGD